ncbi:MAG: hypothetical protein JJT78_07405 [Leptospira sp.]|nr:hypothetical protein [Leptospira sp.]
MKIDITSRIFYSSLILYLSYIFLASPADPRPYFKNLAYLLGFLGILRLFININLGFSLTGTIPWRGGYTKAETFHSYTEILDRIIIICLFALLIGAFCFHFVSITYEFRNSFFLGERDFTSMGEVILNVTKGLGYYSPFHGDGNSSYLSHHFAPGIIAYAPFFQIFQDRIALAWGQLFFSIAIIILLVYLLKRSDEELHTKWHIIWIIFIFGNIYSYRLALSYHFEILFVLYFLILYWIRSFRKSANQSPKWMIAEYVLIFLILTVKEDTAVYLSIYYLGESFYFYWKNRKFPIYDFSIALLLILYFGFLQPAIRSYLNVEAQEDWYAIWGHWMDGTNTKSKMQLIQTIICSPGLVWDTVVSKSGVVWELCLGFGFLFFLAPRYWFYIVVVIFIHFLSGREWHNSFYNYYIYTILPVLWIASLQGYKKLIQLSVAKSGYALGFLVLALVMYRNSGDKNFPFSEQSAATHTIVMTEKEKKKRILEIEILSSKIPPRSWVGVQFDLGIFVPVGSQIFPLSETPIVAGKKLDAIITNSYSGFSPYVKPETIQTWEKNWVENHGYIIQSQNGDFKLFSNETKLGK